jgi:hypothetical protein
MPSVVLICGSRAWVDMAPIDDVVAKITPGSLVVQGGAPGADTIARDAAWNRGHHVAEIEARWSRHGKAAGPRRNAAMTLLAPALTAAYAFPLGESKGTWDMVTRLKQAGVETYVWEPGAGLVRYA